ncbi:hypothetical protein AURDEDRAFT_125762 [Auricularia subglabra TFB-10046 SS5]|nr:hypothetical protein AURDEDRAFT_125762 [Auricularia subglabra TFB-10046 SS5]
MLENEHTSDASYPAVDDTSDELDDDQSYNHPNLDQIGDNPGGWTYLVYPDGSPLAINWSRRTGRHGSLELEVQWGDPGATIARFEIPIKGRRANVGHTVKDGSWQAVKLLPRFIWPRKDANERDDAASTASSEAGFEDAWHLLPPYTRYPAGDNWHETAPPLSYDVDDNGATWETRLVMEGPYLATALPFWETRRVASDAASVAPGNEELLRGGPYQRIKGAGGKPMSRRQRVLDWLASLPASPTTVSNSTSAATTTSTATPSGASGGSDLRGRKRVSPSQNLAKVVVPDQIEGLAVQLVGWKFTQAPASPLRLAGAEGRQ